MWETFVDFIITWISLGLISKILGKGLTATKKTLFLAALSNAIFGAIFRYSAYLGVIYSPIKPNPLVVAGIAFLIALFILPAFTFWFADKFIKGFKVRGRKYFAIACTWFVVIGIIGHAIVGSLPFLGLGLFGLGSRAIGYNARPDWVYDSYDYGYFYGYYYDA